MGKADRLLFDSRAPPTLGRISQSRASDSNPPMRRPDRFGHVEDATMAKDKFSDGPVYVENFAVIFDNAGKPTGISGVVDGQPIVELGKVELQTTVTGDSLELTHVQVDQQATKGRRLCCKYGTCKEN